MPSSFRFTYSPVNGRSVPCRRRISYCSGVSRSRHSSSVSSTSRLVSVSCVAMDTTVAHGEVGSTSMEFGVGIFPTEDAQSPAELARMAEERGFESLLFPEHTHIPASRETPYPAGGELPPEYSRTYDPFVALTAAATATERLKIGTGICLVIERDPIITAKEVASLDRLSGGRFLFGVGAGWNAEEMRNHGTDPAAPVRDHARADRGDEGDLDRGRGELLRSLRELRADLVLAEAGAAAAPADPASAATAPKVIDRVLAYGDEWMPNRVGDDDEMIARIRGARAAAPRRPAASRSRSRSRA